MRLTAAGWYMRTVGILFLLVGFSLVADLAQYGFHPETMHKAFHVLLGSAVVLFWWNSAVAWRPFALVNGALFSFVALF